MNQTGYTILKLSKFDGTYVYAKKAREFATGATGAGGYLNAQAIASGWNDVQFSNIVGPKTIATLPTTIGIGATTVFSGGVTVIGGTTPNGDLRAEATGYMGIGNTTPYIFEKGVDYTGAFYATYIGGTSSLPTKIGIGTTNSQISTSGYYAGNFITNDIYEFQTSFNADSTDLSKITTGSGVYTEGADVTLQFNILNRNGELLSSAAQIAADPFVSGQKISILNTDGTVAFSDYRIGEDSTFTFSSSQNIDVFGSFTRNFGIRNQVVNQDGGVHTSEFYLYANTATFDKVFVSSSGQTVLNESYSNHNPPDTGSITSAADRANAIKYFNNQPINTSGVTGFIEFDLGFNESPNFTSLGDLVLFYGTGQDFTTNRSSLVGNYPLNSVQEGQRIRLTANDGIPEGTGLFFKLAADTEVGFKEELFTVGPFTLEPEVEGPDLNVYNQSTAQQIIISDLSIQGGVGGTATQGGHLGIGTSAVSSSQMLIQGNNTSVEIANSEGYAINSEQKSALASIGGTISSTGSMIAGGSGHHISGDFDTIAGGALGNISGGDFNFIGGGSGIDIADSSYSSSVGGHNNDISSSPYSVIGGGQNNLISGGNKNFLGGGSLNEISGSSSESAIVAGTSNLVVGTNSTVLGGNSNKAFSSYSVIGGGEQNITRGEFSAILAGEDNKTHATHSIIAGGNENIASGTYSFIGGGQFNTVLANYGIAAGRNSTVLAGHTGAVVFSDAHNVVAESTGHNTFNLHFADGVYVTGNSGIFINGNPVLTGENNPAEADTLQTVTNRGNETTKSIINLQGTILPSQTCWTEPPLCIPSSQARNCDPYKFNRLNWWNMGTEYLRK